MKTTCAIGVILFAATLEAQSTGVRVRMENPGSEGRVAVIVADENVMSVSSSVPGVVSGEAVTVEAPAPLVRLGGGSMSGDPLLEAIVVQKVRAATPRRPNVLVLRSNEPYRLESHNYGYAHRGFVDAEFIGWGVPYRSYSHSTRRTSSHHKPSIRARRSVPVRSSRSGGSFSSRGMMPKR